MSILDWANTDNKNFLNKKLEVDRIFKNVFFVNSKSQPGIYHKVAYMQNSNIWICDCSDFKDRLIHSDEKKCVHIREAEPQIFLRPAQPQSELGNLKICDNCFSTEFKKSGYRKLFDGSKRQRLACKKCGHRVSSWSDGFRKMKHSPENVYQSLSLVLKGMSFRDVALYLSEEKNLRIPYTTIYYWYTKYMELIAETVIHILPPKLGEVWSVDEMMIKIKNTKKMGKGYYAWLWIVIDVKTRYIIASTISKRRDISDARKVLAKAKKRSGKTPLYIISDSLRAYKKAIIREFGFETVAHIKTKSINKGFENRPVERYNNEFRAVTKSNRGFGNDKSALKFAEYYASYHNHIRPHTGLPNNQTPAVAAGIDLKLGNNKFEDLIKKSAEPEYKFAIHLGWRKKYVKILNEGDGLRITPKGWIDKKIWREINDILGLYKFGWLKNSKDGGCWIRLKQLKLLEYCN